jgi:DNA-binding response OmpR family regulator
MRRTLLYIGEDPNIAQVLTQVVTQDLRCDLVWAFDMAEGVVAAQDHDFAWVLLDAVTDIEPTVALLRHLNGNLCDYPVRKMVIVRKDIHTFDKLTLMNAGADDFTAVNHLHQPSFASVLRACL